MRDDVSRHNNIDNSSGLQLVDYSCCWQQWLLSTVAVMAAVIATCALHVRAVEMYSQHGSSDGWWQSNSQQCFDSRQDFDRWWRKGREVEESWMVRRVLRDNFKEILQRLEGLKGLECRIRERNQWILWGLNLYLKG